jgi:hypothetical protein
MDKQVDFRFERIEKALANLIESITKFHPSTVQSNQLEIAETELAKSLDEGRLGLAKFSRQNDMLTGSNSRAPSKQCRTAPCPTHSGDFK